MGQKVINGSQKMSEAIRSRRLELGLTIEEAAMRAGVGTKTWCRYEAGGAIRKDKSKGICKALNWRMLQGEVIEETGTEFNIEDYKNHYAWSEDICESYGEAAAISFVIGSDILLDNLEEDLFELERLPKGTHVGQLAVSMIKDMLPKQFLMRYDYDFLYQLKICVKKLRTNAKYNVPLVAHTVMQELAIYLIVEEAEFLMESMSSDMEMCGIEGLDEWHNWMFDLFEDMDIVTCLYSDDYLSKDHNYHFDYWTQEQFWVEG